MLIFIALSVVSGHNSSEHIGIFIVCKQSQQHVFGSHAADPPKITTHPHGMKDAVPGNLVAFTIQATGTEPLNYQWERKLGDENDMERIPGANGSRFTISDVQKPNEGSYRCTVSNCAGSETSECATLTVGKNCCEKTMQSTGGPTSCTSTISSATGCIGWVWYLANDMRFFVVAPLMIVPLYYNWIVGLVCVGLFLAGSYIGRVNSSTHMTNHFEWNSLHCL